MREEELLEFVTWLWESRGIRLFDVEDEEFLSVEDLRWQVVDWNERRRAFG